MTFASPASSRDWSFGPIPEDWRALPLKYLCSRSSIYGANIAADAYENDGVRFLRTTDIRDDGALNEGGVFVPADIVADYMLSEGDFLISRSGTVGRAYVYRPSHGPCAYAGYLVRYALRDPETAQWLFYITKSPGFHQWLGAAAIEATIGNVNGEKYANLLVPVPPIHQQRAIADYLDRETGRLDALVAAKGRMLGLLVEKRSTLISHAVTRGLDPRASFRDSGIPWLGAIPAHWQLKRAKWLFWERDQRSTTGEEVLLSLRMERGLVPHNDVSLKQTQPDELVGYKQVSNGEIVVNRMRAASGLVAIAPQNGLVSPDYAVFRVSPSANAEYFTHLFRTELMQAVFRSESTGLGTGSSGFLRLYSENFLSLWFPYPPANEQTAILAHIDNELAKLDAIRAATERTVTLLKERRAALIAAAVTGKIDVASAA